MQGQGTHLRSATEERGAADPHSLGSAHKLAAASDEQNLLTHQPKESSEVIMRMRALILAGALAALIGTNAWAAVLYVNVNNSTPAAPYTS